MLTVINWQKLTRNNPNLDLVNVDAYMYAKFDQIRSFSQDIEQKRSIMVLGRNHGIRNHRMTDNRKTVYPIPSHTSYAGV